MCGIAGHLAFQPGSFDSEAARRLSRRLAHRGPDDLGFLGWSPGRRPAGSREPRTLAGSRLWLVHRRLSILDPSEAGAQPMGTADGRHYIVFNGEIYNFVELRRELEKLGHEFRSQSDTEVLLVAYARWGVNCLGRLVGMFALAILDLERHELCLARDCFGIKPLFYVRDRSRFAFASEIKALRASGSGLRRVNHRRLYDYLRFGITDHGGETLFEEIHQLPAAHYLRIPLDGSAATHPVRYWHPSCDPIDLPLPEAAAQLRELFLENVRLHLRSDVPVGAALSGGIDSSAIVMAMRRLHGSDLDIHTFSYVADQASLSEEAWVDLVGQASGVRVHKVHPRATDLVADLDHLIEAQDEPFGSTSIYAQFCVFRLAQRAGIKVLLDGQGADELLAGYRSYLAGRLASLLRAARWGQAWRFLGRARALPGVAGASLAVRAGGMLLPGWLRGPARRLVGEELDPPWLDAAWFAERGVSLRRPGSGRAGMGLREQLFESLFETSLPMLLRYEDRNSMAFSIESRVPFLTPRLVEFVLSLPEEHLVAPDATSKSVFRHAMRGIVPDAILDRRDKIGFATPEQPWLTVLRPWVEGVLSSPAAASIPALKPAAIRTEWRELLAGRRSFDFRVWRWINLIRWAELSDVQFAD